MGRMQKWAFRKRPNWQRSALKANLSPEMTVDALKQRLITVLNKKVDITLKGSFAFWLSTCPVPADCYF